MYNHRAKTVRYGYIKSDLSGDFPLNYQFSLDVMQASSAVVCPDIARQDNYGGQR
jgi:hypothetical protein